MLAQVLEVMCPGVPYTSSGTWESVVFNDGNFYKPTDEMYELTMYQLTNAEAIKKMRERRDTLLDKSDKYMTRDYPHRLELDVQNWTAYRQALRDLPVTARPTLDEDGNLVNIEWPTLPTSTP
tara:strand:- start:47 stop:415 length:369 start_codon:yes stop_codon:yes gene_type:complete